MNGLLEFKHNIVFFFKEKIRGRGSFCQISYILKQSLASKLEHCHLASTQKLEMCLKSILARKISVVSYSNIQIPREVSWISPRLLTRHINLGYGNYVVISISFGINIIVKFRYIMVLIITKETLYRHSLFAQVTCWH